MAFPRIPRRWRLRTSMIVVAACAVGLVAYREYVERGPIYWELLRLRFGGAATRDDAALRLGLLGPRAAIAVGALNSALHDPDRDVRTDAAYSLIRLGSRSPRLLPILAEEILRPPAPGSFSGLRMGRHPTFQFVEPPKGWTLWAGGLYDNDPMAALSLLRPDAKAFVPMLKAALKPPARWGRGPAMLAVFTCATWSDPSGGFVAKPPPDAKPLMLNPV